jgi:hypothetical protein
MKKLYVVTIETEILVVAESEEEASEVAEESLRDIDNDQWDKNARPMLFLPHDWEEGSIPFGDRDPSDPDRTIGGWIKAGAAPEYVALNKKLKAKIEKVQP